MSDLTQDRLKEVLHYSPDTGDFTWLVSRGSVKSGIIAGVINGQGYRCIAIDKVQLQAHRLAFLYLYGEMPPDQVDHINGIRHDNRRGNLRRVDHATNSKNRSVPKNSTSGFMGVYWNKVECKWRSYIYVNGKSRHLGYFIDKKSAINARKFAEIKYGFHTNHGREMQ